MEVDDLEAGWVGLSWSETGSVNDQISSDFGDLAYEVYDSGNVYCLRNTKEDSNEFPFR